jgi:hypothetical protein
MVKTFFEEIIPLPEERKKEERKRKKSVVKDRWKEEREGGKERGKKGRNIVRKRRKEGRSKGKRKDVERCHWFICAVFPHSFIKLIEIREINLQ